MVECLVWDQDAAGSSPVASTKKGSNHQGFCLIYGSIAQLGEHLPYKQRVTGSSPVVPTIRNCLFIETVPFFINKTIYTSYF